MEEDFNKICRLCMHIRKHLRPISEKVANFTYADLIYKVTNVKITEEQNLPNKICTFCRTKAREGYQFIEMVEKSEHELRRKAGLSSKRIKFNNIEDIKVEIDIKEVKVKREKVVDYSNIVSFDFVEDEDIVYNNTVIKKVQTDNDFDYDKTKNSQLSVGDFLNSIKENEDDDIDYNDCDIDIEPVNSYSERESDDDKPLSTRKKKRKKKDDEDYIPGAQNKKPATKLKNDYHRRWNKTGRYNTKRLTGEETVLKVAIKPVLIKDRNIMLKPTPYPRKPRAKPKQTKPDGALCPYCGLYVKHHSMKEHILRHTGSRDHICTVCAKGYYTAHSLQAHHRQCHSAPTLQCDFCKAKFTTKNRLESHMYSHTEVRDFICDVCNKGFKRKRALLRHMVRHNDANKKVNCELCSFTFFEQAQLRHHMRIHTGERPYKCELCNQPYSYKRDFNRHCMKKHGIFFKRRSEAVLNEEVLAREKEFMKELYLRSKGIMRDDQPVNPFDGPAAEKTFKAALQAIETNVIPVERIFDNVNFG